jgi:hypothetical protein
MRLQARNAPINSTDDWYRLAPPRGGKRHWKVGRSALELARAWCPAPGGPTPPRELVTLLASHPLSCDIAFADAEGTPELRVPLDSFDGEPRNTDLALVALTAARPPVRVAISVEAKADESFGQRVLGAVRAAERRRAAGKPSNGDERARRLAVALFGPGAASDPAVDALRYQLLTATAGALAFARQRRADVAVLVVHEFVDPAGTRTRRARLAANANDLDAFVTRLSDGRCTRVVVGQHAGVFVVPGNAHIPGDIPLLLGKVTRDIP